MGILRNLGGRVKGAGSWLFGNAAYHGLHAGMSGLLEKFKDDPEGVKTAIEKIGSALKSNPKGKGLMDQVLFGKVIDLCDLSTAQRKFLVEVLNEMIAEGGEARQLAENFIIVIALGGDQPDDKGKVPGQYIIDGFIHRLADFSGQEKNWIRKNVKLIGRDAQVRSLVDSLREFGGDVAQKAWAAISGLDQFAAGKVDQATDAMTSFFDAPKKKKEAERSRKKALKEERQRLKREKKEQRSREKKQEKKERRGRKDAEKARKRRSRKSLISGISGAIKDWADNLEE